MLKGAGPLLAVSLLFAVTACDMPWSQHDGGTPPPDRGSDIETGTALPPPGGEVVVPPEGGTLGTDRLETEVTTDGNSMSVKEVVRAPDGSNWSAGADNDEQRRLDMESCFDYAVAQIRRDEQIVSDQNAGLSNINNNSRYAFMQQQQAGFGFQQRRNRLFSSCMESKGYNRL